MTRLKRLTELTGVGRHGYTFANLNNGEGLTHGDDLPVTEGEVPQFLLVETNSAGSETWYSLHAHADDAATYHDTQEAIEYWSDYDLYDLDTGERYYPEITTTWVKADDV